MKTLLSLTGLSLALALTSLTGCGGGGVSCAPGYEGCACTLEGTCNVGLQCVTTSETTNQCVNPSAGTGGVQGNTGGSGSGGEPATGGDGNSTGGMPGSGGGGSNTGGGGGVPTTGGAPSSGGGGNVPSNCTEGATRGSCSTGNSEVCFGGEWVESEGCEACAILSPSVCGRVVAFVLDTERDYAAVPSALTNVEYASTGVTAQFNFTSYSQMGYIQFQLSSPVSPASVATELASTTTVAHLSGTLETATSDAGCEYASNGSEFLPVGSCWGGFYEMGELYTGSTSSAASIVAIRVSPSVLGPVTLVVSSVDLYL